MHRAFAREHAAAAVHQCASQRACIQPHRDLIGKPGKHAALDRPWLDLALRDVETFIAGDGQKLLPELRRLARGAGVDSKARTTLRIEVIFFREAKRAHQNEEIRFSLAAEDILALVAHLLALRAPEQIAALGERGDERNPRTQRCSCAASSMRA